MRRSLISAAALACFASAAYGQAVKVDPKLPEYKVAQGVAGTIKSQKTANGMTSTTLKATEFYTQVKHVELTQTFSN